MDGRRIESWMCAMLLVAAVTTVATAEDASRVRSVTLKNGMQVLMLADPQATAVDVAVWYRAGTRSEAVGKTGLSSLFGRLMFDGSKNVAAGEHLRRLQAEGATVNSAIRPDYSCFYQTLPCESVDLALELEADRMASLALTPQVFEAERRAARDERRRRLEGNPLGLGLQRLYAIAFGGHPYARPDAGLAEDLERLTLDDAVAYHRDRYGPQDAVLTVVGCVDPEPTLAAIRRRFEALPKRPDPPVPAPAIAPAKTRRAAETAAVPGPLLMVGWNAPGAADPDRPAFELLSNVISSGGSSRLQQLRNARKNVFLLVNGDLDVSKEGSLLFCLAAVRARSDSAAAESALVASIQRLAQQPVSAEELDRARHQTESSMLFGLQTVRGRADALGAAQMLDGDYRAADKRLDQVRRLTAADLQRAAARLFTDKNRSVVWLMPAGAPATGGRP